MTENFLSEWSIVIGLEVHCQIISEAKLFSGSSTKFGSLPNTQVAFLDAGYPGTLPVINKECIKQAVKTGLALSGNINKLSYFDRKHYFYPDNPLGYQITQFYTPIMENGRLIINLEDGTSKAIRIERLHIEQDAGKLLHDHHATKSLVDLNRAGVALMEIVSYPDLSSAQEVAEYVTKLRSILRYIGACDGSMEEGSMRCDINVSVRRHNEGSLRTRVEIKNVNSIRFIMRAINYEAQRQVELWEAGKEVVQETRLFDPNKGITLPLRSKEDATDYRYIREPDLQPLELTEEYISSIKDELPVLPDERKEKFISDYGIGAQDAAVLTKEREVADFFEETVNASSERITPTLAVSWLTTNLFAKLNEEGLEITESKVSPKALNDLLLCLEKNTISSKMAKKVFEIMWSSPSKSVAQIVKEENMSQITDPAVIEALVNEVLAENQDKVEEIKAGKDRLLPWLVGQVIKKSKGQANPELANRLLRKKIIA